MRRKRHKFPLVDDVKHQVEDVVQARDVVLSAARNSNRLVVISRNNKVGIGRDGELVGFVFLLERVFEFERLSIPDLHHIIITGTHKNAPVGRVLNAKDVIGVSLVDALHQASIRQGVPKFDRMIATSSRAKEFAVGREREGPDAVGVALRRVH